MLHYLEFFVPIMVVSICLICSDSFLNNRTFSTISTMFRHPSKLKKHNLWIELFSTFSTLRRTVTFFQIIFGPRYCQQPWYTQTGYAEYISTCNASRAAIGLSNFFTHLIRLLPPILIFVLIKIQGSVSVAHYGSTNSQNRNFSIRYHLIRDSVRSRLVNKSYSSSPVQLEDTLTNNLVKVLVKILKFSQKVSSQNFLEIQTFFAEAGKR